MTITIPAWILWTAAVLLGAPLLLLLLLTAAFGATMLIAMHRDGGFFRGF